MHGIKPVLIAIIHQDRAGDVLVDTVRLHDGIMVIFYPMDQII